MIIASSAARALEIEFDAALWDLPAAIAYQAHFMRCQEEGVALYQDNSFWIRKALLDARD